MALHCHIDGRPVKLNDDLEATVTAAGGYETLTASADRRQLGVRKAHQGSTIHLDTEAGEEIWFGTLDSTPALPRHDVVRISATGPVAAARRQTADRFYQSRDYGEWKAQDSDPYGYGTTGRIQVDSQGGRLNYTLPNGTDIKQNNTNGLVAWFPDEPVSNIKFDWASTGATTNMVLQVWSMAGPSGTRTQQGIDISLNATSGTVDYPIALANADAVNLVLIWTAADATTSSHYRLRITNLRVNGRIPGDDASPGQIISVLAGELGWNTTRVESSGQNALPLYWEGGPWSDLIDGLALLDDWPWLVDRNGIDYGPWEEKATLRFSVEGEDLDFPPIYNRVRVNYTTLAGAPRSALVTASPDPLARWDAELEYQVDLGESYADDAVPTAVGNVLIDRLAEQRVVGTVTITHGRLVRTKRVWTPHRRSTVRFYGEDQYRIRPGMLAVLEPYPNLPPQRIIGTRIHPHDMQIQFGEDIEQVTVARTLARTALTRARLRRRLHPRKP